VSLQAVPCIRRVVTGLSQRRPGLVPRLSLCEVCGVESGIGQASVRVLRVFFVRSVTPMLHTHLRLRVILTSKMQRAKPGNLPTNNARSEFGEGWIEKCFLSCFC
jgi:hypothetical protein